MSRNRILLIMKSILLIMKIILLIMKIILRIVGLETGYAGASENAKKRCMYINILGQNKPFISDGFEVQTIHSQPV